MNTKYTELVKAKNDKVDVTARAAEYNELLATDINAMIATQEGTILRQNGVVKRAVTKELDVKATLTDSAENYVGLVLDAQKATNSATKKLDAMKAMKKELEGLLDLFADTKVA